MNQGKLSLSLSQTLILSPTQVSELLEAVSVHLSHKTVYRKASIRIKIIMLTTQLLVARKLLDIQSELDDLTKTTFNKEYFKEFMKNVENSYLVRSMREKVEISSFRFEAGDINKKDLKSDIFKFYNYVKASEVVQKLKDIEDFKEDLFDAQVYVKNIFNIIMNEYDFGIKGKSHLAFYKEPSKYIHSSKHVNVSNDPYVVEAREYDMKICILLLHVGVPFIKNEDRLKDFIKMVDPKTDIDVTEELTSKLHYFSIAKKTIFNHRINEIVDIVYSFLDKERFGYDTVLSSVVRSVVFCKQNKVTSFLEVTNLIINNLLVEAFTNRKMRSEIEKEINKVVTYADSINPNVVILMDNIANYVESFYKNKHTRACAYSVSSAIKQALGYMSKHEPDLFTKTNK